MFKKRTMWYILLMLFDFIVLFLVALFFGNEPWMKWYKEATSVDGMQIGAIFMICQIFVLAWLAQLIPPFGKWWDGLKD